MFGVLLCVRPIQFLTRASIADVTAIIFGSSFWGAAMAVSGIACFECPQSKSYCLIVAFLIIVLVSVPQSLYIFLIVFVITMLVVWPFTRPLTLIVLSNGTSLGATISGVVATNSHTIYHSYRHCRDTRGEDDLPHLFAESFVQGAVPSSTSIIKHPYGCVGVLEPVSAGCSRRQHSKQNANIFVTAPSPAFDAVDLRWVRFWLG